MSTWRCGWICPRSYFVVAVFLAGASLAVLLAGAFLAGVSPSKSSRPGLRVATVGCIGVMLLSDEWGEGVRQVFRHLPELRW
jgi:hypothetical protein